MRVRNASTLLRAVMTFSACRAWASVMDGTPIVSKFEQTFHDGAAAESIEQNFHVLKGTKISFYTVAGSSYPIRRMRGAGGRRRLFSLPRGFIDEDVYGPSANHGCRCHDPCGG